MNKAAGIAASLCFALVCPAAPAVSAQTCPDVDTARGMLLKAAAAKNDQDLKQMPRNVPANPPGQPGAPGQPPQPGQPAPKGPKGAQKQGKAQPGVQPQPAQPAQPGQQDQQEAAQQDKDAAPNVETAPVPEDLKRAALLVKQADDACQAGQAGEASEKAKAAMALMKR